MNNIQEAISNIEQACETIDKFHANYGFIMENMYSFNLLRMKDAMQEHAKDLVNIITMYGEC